MTTSISNVTAGSAAASSTSTQKTSSLSEETKKKLEALGITATDDMTEAQATALINAAQQKGAQQGGENQQDSQSDVRAEAKTLAASMGIVVSDDAETDEILNDIGEEIEVMLEEAETNPAILPSLSSYLSELTNLDDRYETLQARQESIYAAMDVISENKKMELGLS